MQQKPIILLNRSIFTPDFDKSILENISWSYDNFSTHHDIAAGLRDKNPYTVTVLIENLKYKHWNNTKYVIKTKTATGSKYRELLYDYFFQEYGEREGNEIYGKWLDRYRTLYKKTGEYESVDDYIIEREFEPRYKAKILKRFKNHGKLFKDRVRIDRERIYNLPEPLNYIDWRNPYDNIFVWEENGKKVAARGGSGSSGGRERNSKFIYGLLKLNKIKPVPSYLFLYSEDNTLLFINKFDSLCIPHFDIGSNYQIDRQAEEKLKQGGLFLDWNTFGKIRSITATSFSQSIKLAIKRYEQK